MLGGIPLANLTAPTLLGITVLFILVGLLVPRYVYREKVKECDQWRSAWETESNARKESESQKAELLELAKTTHAIVAAALGDGEHYRQSGEAHVVSTPTRP